MLKLLLLLSVFNIYLFADTCFDHYKFGSPKYENNEVEMNIKEVCYKSHVIGFNTKMKTAQWVEYKLNSNILEVLVKTNKKYLRKDYPYQFDHNIKEEEQVNTRDYDGFWSEHNIDRGHLAPYKNVGISESDKINVNKMSNIVAQNAGLNRKCWYQHEKNIFNRVKDNNASLVVTVGVIYNKATKPLEHNSKKIKMPTDMFMIIIDENTKKTDIVFFPNKSRDKNECFESEYTKITTEEMIEKRLEIDFYPNK
jgi:DNA/RNA endonuclease G (NUC1)